MSATRTGQWLLLGTGVVVVAAVAAAVLAMGTPGQQRDARMDDRRIRDLERIRNAVGEYFERKGALPADIAMLARRPGARLAIADPVTHAPYGYQVTGAREFRLCATFVTDTAQGDAGDGPGQEWWHGVGYRGVRTRGRTREVSSGNAGTGV